MEKNTHRFIKESEGLEEPQSARFISVEDPMIRDDGGNDEHKHESHSWLWKVCILFLIPVCILVAFYMLIDNPRGPLYDQSPSVAYRGETETGSIEFYFIGSLPKSYFYDNSVGLEFYVESPSSSSVYYGYIPSATIHRSNDEYNENSYFVVNTNEVYEHRSSIIGDDEFHEDIKKPLERGKKYIVKISGTHRGIIFKRPERVRYCSFTLEEKKDITTAEDISSSGIISQDTESSVTTMNKSKNKPMATTGSNATSRTESTTSKRTVSHPNSNATSPVADPANTSLETGHEWVDLGTGARWATCNLGASCSTDDGSWYAWGETRPKVSSSWSNYNLRSSGDDINNVIFTKYNTRDRWGVIDNKIKLEASDDAARQTWGGRWRTPTKEEWEALINKCSWVWTSVNGVYGYQVTGTNGRSIFLPKAGRQGIYWSSSLKQDEPPFAWSFVMLSGNYYMEDYNRTCLYMIRPVF